MALSFQLGKEQLEKLPSDLQAHYREITDGASKGMFRLQFEGADPVATYRDTNVDLMRQLREATEQAATTKAAKEATDAILAKYRDDDGNPLDPDEMKRIRKELQAKSGGKKDAGIDDALRPLQQQIADLTRKLTEADQQREAEAKRAKRATLESKLREAVDPVLVPGTAGFVVKDMLDNDAFDLDEAGAVIPKKRADDGTPITHQRYLDTLRQSTPGIFRQSTSGDDKEITGARIISRADGVKELINPTSLEMGEHAADIAAGKVKVVRRR